MAENYGAVFGPANNLTLSQINFFQPQRPLTNFYQPQRPQIKFYQPSQPAYFRNIYQPEFNVQQLRPNNCQQLIIIQTLPNLTNTQEESTTKIGSPNSS
jgi:hypothetical protein